MAKQIRVITLNVNGIRAAARKGMFTWLTKQKADVVCLQEIRAQKEQLVDPMFHPKAFHCYYVEAQKKGYSGVAIYSRQKPDNVVEQLGFDLADKEGRYLEITLGDLTVVSLYLPSGSHSEERQTLKYQFMDRYLPKLQTMLKSKKLVIVCGDWNIAHKKIDIKNWRANQKNSGFLPEERAWLDTLFDEKGWVDAFRVLNQQEDQYTWWSNRGRAWDNNVGWRIDYQVITPNLKDAVEKVSIYKQQRFSDHAPLIIDYQLND